jgi:hypothetical protein
MSSRLFVFVLFVGIAQAKLGPPSPQLLMCLPQCENPIIVWPKCQQVGDCLDDCVNTSPYVLFTRQMKYMACEPQCGQFPPKCVDIINCLVACVHPMPTTLPKTEIPDPPILFVVAILSLMLLLICSRL